MAVKNNVRDRREGAGMTQEELAEKVGVSRQTIIAMERGSYSPSVELAIRLAAVFSVSVEDLFTLTK